MRKRKIEREVKQFNPISQNHCFITVAVPTEHQLFDCRKSGSFCFLKFRLFIQSILLKFKVSEIELLCSEGNWSVTKAGVIASLYE